MAGTLLSSLHRILIVVTLYLFLTLTAVADDSSTESSSGSIQSVNPSVLEPQFYTDAPPAAGRRRMRKRVDQYTCGSSYSDKSLSCEHVTAPELDTNFRHATSPVTVTASHTLKAPAIATSSDAGWSRSDKIALGVGLSVPMAALIVSIIALTLQLRKDSSTTGKAIRKWWHAVFKKLKKLGKR